MRTARHDWLVGCTLGHCNTVPWPVGRHAWVRTSTRRWCPSVTVAESRRGRPSTAHRCLRPLLPTVSTPLDVRVRRRATAATRRRRSQPGALVDRVQRHRVRLTERSLRCAQGCSDPWRHRRPEAGRLSVDRDVDHIWRARCHQARRCTDRLPGPSPVTWLVVWQARRRRRYHPRW